MEERELSCTVSGNVNWHSHYGEQYRDSFRKTRNKLPYDPVIPLLGTYPAWVLHFYKIIYMCCHHLAAKSCPALLWLPWTIACQAPLSMGFPRQEYWSGLLFLFPADLPNPGIKPGSLALQADSLPSEPPWKPTYMCVCVCVCSCIEKKTLSLYVN